MLNYLWASMIIISILVGSLNGRIAEVGAAALDSSKEAVTLCITMLGIMSLWMGLMRIAKTSGLIDKLSSLLSPVLRFLFPDIPAGHPSLEYIASNLIANILGLGWAATPFGLKAMKELAALEDERRRLSSPLRRPAGYAGNEMCTFLIINISSLQLIPVNLIAYRSQYGSANPSAIIAPAILATAVSTGTAIVFCKIMNHGRQGRRGGL